MDSYSYQDCDWSCVYTTNVNEMVLGCGAQPVTVSSKIGAPVKLLSRTASVGGYGYPLIPDPGFSMAQAPPPISAAQRRASLAGVPVTRAEETDPSISSHSDIINDRYKTEYCRSFLENGSCRYAERCQFAHGQAELRSLPRHPRYKTEMCRTFHMEGYCPYGLRCHFIHGPRSLGGPKEDSAAALISANPPSSVTMQTARIPIATERGMPTRFRIEVPGAGREPLRLPLSGSTSSDLGSYGSSVGSSSNGSPPLPLMVLPGCDSPTMPNFSPSSGCGCSVASGSDCVHSFRGSKAAPERSGMAFYNGAGYIITGSYSGNSDQFTHGDPNLVSPALSDNVFSPPIGAVQGSPQDVGQYPRGRVPVSASPEIYAAQQIFNFNPDTAVPSPVVSGPGSHSAWSPAYCDPSQSPPSSYRSTSELHQQIANCSPGFSYGYQPAADSPLLATPKKEGVRGGSVSTVSDEMELLSLLASPAEFISNPASGYSGAGSSSKLLNGAWRPSASQSGC